jgi:hypothetical protein
MDFYSLWFPSQCCGSRIRCLFDPWIRNPGWVKKIKNRVRIRDEHPRSYFRELRNNFLMWIRIRIRGNTGRNSPGFNSSILRHSGIWGAADEAVAKKVYKIQAKKGFYKKRNILASLFSFFPVYSSKWIHSSVGRGGWGGGGAWMDPMWRQQK